VSPATIFTIASEAQQEILCLTEGLSRGDRPAWEEFFHLYVPRLRAYIATCWLGDSPPLDDLLQETVLRVTRHVRGFGTEEAFWSWLTVLARSAIADHGRRRSTWSRFLERYLDHHKSLADVWETPEPRIEAALESLAPDSRALIEAKYDRRQSVRHLAEKHGVSEKIIEHRLARARRELSRALKR